MTRPWAPLAAYLLAAAVFTWPLALQPTSHLAALQGPGDPYLNLWILGWDLRMLSSDPVAVVTGRIFDANIFHPARGTLAYSDHLILQAVALWPVYALSGDPVLCYNLLFVASLVAAALAMHVFVRAVTGSTWGACAAGLAWGFWPYRFAHLVHPQLQALYFLPLAFLFLHRLVAGRRRLDAFGLGVMAALQAISSVYYGVIGAVGLAVAAVVLALATGRRRLGRLGSRLILAGVVGIVLIAPAVWPYAQVQRQEGFSRNLFEASRHAASTASYLDVPPTNWLHGHALPGGAGRTTAGVERGLFPGATLLVLAAVGLAAGSRRRSLAVAATMAAVGAVGFVLSLGPDGARTIYATLHRTVFGFDAIRAPARFAVLATFGLAGLAALGMRALAERWRWAPAVAVAALAIEYLNVPLPYVIAPERTTAAGQWLRAAPEPGAVVYLPLALDAENTPFMVQSLEHGRPIVNGYSGQRPSFYPALVDTLSQFPSAEALWTLKDLDVRFIVSPQAVDAREPLVERARLETTVIYELRWTPEVEARLARPDPPAPPAPGPPPFRPGERAVYRVSIVSGPGAAVGLDAGEATVVVAAAPDRLGGPAEPGGGGAAYLFTATGTTADWVSRFFEAQDRFATLATIDLLPLRHERQIREGRRRLDLTVEYDHAARRVRLRDGVALQIPPGTRDPLTAFFYVRSLGLEPGQALVLPLNDAGRNLTLQVHAAEVETVAHAGTRVQALRLEPRIIERVGRRPPVGITVWLSRDARRIPLAAEISAPFGALRLELRGYER